MLTSCCCLCSQTPENGYAAPSVTSPSDPQQQPASFLGSSAAGHMLKTVANSSAVTLARGGAAAAAAAGVSGALSFLPNLLQDMVEPSRNFAYINLKVRWGLSLLLAAFCRVMRERCDVFAFSALICCAHPLTFAVCHLLCSRLL